MVLHSSRPFRATAAACAVALAIIPAAADAQIRIGAIVNSETEDVQLCRSPNGTLDVLSSDGDECGDAFTGQPAESIAFGPDPDPTILFDNGDAEFNHTTDFNGETNLNGTTNINGPLNLAGSITAAGVTSTSGMTNTGSFTNNGSVTVTGSLGASSLSAGSANLTGTLTSNAISTGSISASGVATTGGVTVGGFLQGNNGASILGTTQLATVQVFQNLSVQSGATVDMNGNRITEVGGPVNATDAANKAYVDATAGAAQTTANTALANAAAAQGTADTARVEAAAAQTTANTARVEAAAAQDTADTAIVMVDDLGSTTAARLGGGSTYNPATGAISAPSYQIAGDSYSNVGAAFAAVDDQLSMLDTRIGALSDATDLGFKQANGGIAAALALGGTMIVPDSTVSVSFNLATYRGQQGFSGVVAIQAAPKFYISGGVAGSTVKGSTGGRVGVAFGF